MSNRIEQIEQFVKMQMREYKLPALGIGHDFKHVDRVRGWALQIAREEGYDHPDQVAACALLHDVGLSQIDDRQDHAEVGAAMANEFLRANQLFPPDEIEAIAEAIRLHSTLRPGSLLSHILRDADMMELFGAVGLMRAFTSKYAKPEYLPDNVLGETWGLTAEAFTQRFQTDVGIGETIIDQINFQMSCQGNLFTDTAKRLAEPLVAFMRIFIEQLAHEIATGESNQ